MKASFLKFGKFRNFPIFGTNLSIDHANYIYKLLVSAASLGSVKCIEILHENGAEIDAIDQNGQTPFHQAVAAGQTDSAKLFISFGARLSAQDKRLRCCIHLAVEQGREETLSMLLSETGSDLVNIPDHKQRTSLHYASRADNPKVLTGNTFVI